MSARAQELLSRYDRAHPEWVRRVAVYDAAAFSFTPRGEEWSVAEVVDHLHAVQEKCLGEMDRCLTGDGEFGRSRIAQPYALDALREMGHAMRAAGGRSADVRPRRA